MKQVNWRHPNSRKIVYCTKLFVDRDAMTLDLSIQQEKNNQRDARSVSIAAASIIAKYIETN